MQASEGGKTAPSGSAAGGEPSAPSKRDSLTPAQTREMKKNPKDFIFGKVIGEGSYSTVFLAKEVSSGKEFAIKVLDKKHILKEKKAAYVKREKEVFSRLNHPFFIRMYYTFQDTDRLYFALSYARRGELLDYIKKLGCFDENCTKFYTAEIVLALEYLHSLGIIHRDLKPENILLNDQMHIQITDFGSAKILDQAPEVAAEPEKRDSFQRQRKNSFVGTAQYVSPEVLTSKNAYHSCDLWALGCIVYQLLSGHLPFWGGHEYQIFQKITKLEYEFPKGFPAVARDLVEKLLVVDPTKRLGCDEMGGYSALKDHAFFKGIDWENVDKTSPPELIPYLPAVGEKDQDLWSNVKTGLDDQHLSRLVIDVAPEQQKAKQKDNWITDEEREQMLEKQRKDNAFHRFVEGNCILKQGFIDKRKGLFARRRMFLLTEGPHLYYVDAGAMVLKGQVPWSKELRPEAKNFKIFFVHTPNRTYYLEDPEGNALKWCKKFEEVWAHYFKPEGS